jgi:hypothetical protein
VKLLRWLRCALGFHDWVAWVGSCPRCWQYSVGKQCLWCDEVEVDGFESTQLQVERAHPAWAKANQGGRSVRKEPHD